MSFFHLFVLGFAVEAAASQHEAVCQTQPVKVVEGDDVTLRCRLRPSSDVTSYTVDWKRVDLNQVVHVYRHRKDDTGPQMERYRNRTKLNHQNLRRGVLDLHITSVHLSDAGQYRCYVPRLSASCTQTITVDVSAGEPVKVHVVFCVSIAAFIVLTLET